MRHLIQVLIVVAVLFSNIHWQWTPNGYLAALIAGFAAYVVTIFPGQLLTLARKLKARFGKKRLEQRFSSRPSTMQGRRQ